MFIGPYLPIGAYGPYTERLRQRFEDVIRRLGAGGQRRKTPTESGAWPAVRNRFRQWRDAGVDSTTARAHHDAAGMHLGEDVLTALEKAAAEAEKARSKGAASKNETGRKPGPVPRGRSGDASGAGEKSG